MSKGGSGWRREEEWMIEEQDNKESSSATITVITSLKWEWLYGFYSTKNFCMYNLKEFVNLPNYSIKPMSLFH